MTGEALLRTFVFLMFLGPLSLFFDNNLVPNCFCRSYLPFDLLILGWLGVR